MKKLLSVLFSLSITTTAFAQSNGFYVPQVTRFNNQPVVLESPELFSQSGGTLSGSTTQAPTKQIFIYDPFLSTKPATLPEATPNSEFGSYLYFDVQTDLNSPADDNSGTTNTIFTFTAKKLDDYLQYRSEYRWDFYNDGKFETFFSTSPSVSFRFAKAGEHQVLLQEMNKSGEIRSYIGNVKVVNNQSPTAELTISSTNIVAGQGIFIDAGKSNDQQQNSQSLLFTFDFDGDGKYDTVSQSISRYFRKYLVPGLYNIKVKVTDLEGKSSTKTTTLSVEKNNPPVPLAKAKIEKGNILFDATATKDDQADQKTLLYKWDFNYQGQDDIIYNTAYTTNSKFTMPSSQITARKFRVTVKDQLGQTKSAIFELVD